MGWSFGGIIAQDLFAALAERGVDVAGTIVLDTPAIGTSDPAQSDFTRWGETHLRKLAEAEFSLGDVDPATLHPLINAKDTGDALSAAIDGFAAQVAPRLPDSARDALHRIFGHFHLIAERTERPQGTAPLLLVCAQDSEGLVRDAQYGWVRDPGAIDVQRIGISHLDMLGPEGVQALDRLIRAWVSRE
jgi:thioesterase domain-containing protein